MSERKQTIKGNFEGLRGINVGYTEICPVGEEEETGLTYRGYPIEQLARKSTFDEVSFLLVNGDLPDKSQLRDWISKLKNARSLPDQVMKFFDILPKNSHPMSVLRTGISIAGNINTEENQNSTEHAIRVIGMIPSLIGYWEKRRKSDSREVPFNSTQETTAGYLLHMINAKPPTDLDRRMMDCSLILYAEHELAASTFATRVCASTLADYYSCIVSGIGTLSGPLNGGANEAAIELLLSFNNADEAEREIRRRLKEKELIMGFGHAVYSDFDPRSLIIKEYAQELANQRPEYKTLYQIAETIERVMWEETKIFPNLDFYTATVYHMVGIDTVLFTPIFVASRCTGWAAHILEQRRNNKLIRPTAKYIGPKKRDYV
ncbi:MAG: citrate/2-methylcitrate synthase [Candidatus Hodarchaeales archaeon]|jgi:2-methylcitrate synthase